MNGQSTKTVLVTGASKGIGKAIAIELSKGGYEIAIHFGRDQQGAEDTLNSIKKNGGKGHLLQFDVRDRESAKSTLERDMAEFGAYYGLVCNAGISRDAAFPAMSDSDWDSVINTNLNGFYNVVKPCVLPMIQSRRPGRIIAMSSVSGVMGNRGQVNYSATKAALIGAVKALSIELAKREITVNCVAPGLIDTEMITEEVFQHAKPLIPMQRMGTPYEVASLVAYLMSEGASYITRQVISINGGMF